MKAVDITVSGKVQGVYFRACTKEEAVKYDIKGWCKNQQNGTVFIHAEGEAKKVEEFLIWCHQGSPLSNVVHVAVEDAEFLGVKKFEIRRF